MNQIMKMADTMDKRNHTFGYFWFDEPHIFEWTQKDFDMELRKYADSGINHIIDFSITHIRWSFYPYWDIINKTIEKLVKACHKNGICLTEHHSSVLLFRPDTPERTKYMEKRFFGKRKGSYKHWPDFIPNCKKGIDVGGKNLNDMCQIDPITGKPFIINEWATNMICVNNPDFIPVYLDYLSELYKLGIDGIMTDDIEMFYHPNVNGRLDTPHCCACDSCREKFKIQTGYKLPECGDDWDQWRENRLNQEYISWLKFRSESVKNFHVKVKEHYESQGQKLLRPNYSATTIHWSNPGGHCFDDLPALDWVMIENTFEHIKRYSWPEWIIEHNHRFALSRYRHIPAAAMFYPHRQDEVEFCWALALNSGIGYLGTANCEPIDLNPWEKPLRNFENSHKNSLTGNKKIARTAFYFSRSTRDLYPDYEGRSRENLITWMFACESGNMQYDLLLQEELELIEKFSVIVLNEAAVMSDKELKKFKNFVFNGGRIIWIGNTASKNESFSKNRIFQDIWGFPAPAYWENYGKGAIKALELEVWTSPLRRRVTAPLRMIKNNEPNYDYKELSAEEKNLHCLIVEQIKEAMDNKPDLTVEHAPRGVLAHIFISENNDKLLIHFLNTVDTLNMPEAGYVMDCDPLPFPELSKKIGIKVRKPEFFYAISSYSAKLCVPYHKDMAIDIVESGDYLQLELPPYPFKFYAMLKIECTQD